MDKRQARKKKHAEGSRRHREAQRLRIQKSFRVLRREHFHADGPYSHYTMSLSAMLMLLAQKYKMPISEIREVLRLPAKAETFTEAELDAQYDMWLAERQLKHEQQDADALMLHCEDILRTVDSAAPRPDVEYAHLNYIEEP